MTSHIAIVSAGVGAGHDGAAAELARRLSLRGFSVTRHDFLDLLPATLGDALRHAYAAQLRTAPESWGRLFTALDRRPGLAASARRFSGLAARRITRTVGPGCAAVVSTYPLAGQALGGLRRRGTLTAPVITYLTDLSVHPLWVAAGVDAHLALHPSTAARARLLGAAGVRVAGPAVRPAFRPASALERDAARLRFGLHGGAPKALVVAGAWGAGDVAATARDIAASGLATPVVVCGRNTALRETLTRSGTGIALGWVDDMPTLMRACDVVVQNAGGLSSLEALATGLPVLSYRCLPGHGSTNAAALDQAGWAPWIHDPNALPAALATALAARPATPSTPPGPATPFAPPGSSGAAMPFASALDVRPVAPFAAATDPAEIIAAALACPAAARALVEAS